MKVLMTYCNILGTTAIYLRNAMKRAGFEVTSIGENCDINTGRNNPYDSIPSVLEKDKYDFVFEVESGGFELNWNPDREKINIPVVWYGIDTHMSLQHHLNRAKFYDLIFLAQKQYVPYFKNSVVMWVPLACDPEFHKGNIDCPKEYEITFIGNHSNGAHNRRTELLGALKHNSKLNLKKNVWYKDVTSEYEKSYLIFNCSLRNDLNMRVFEALASGGMVITDRVDEAGGSEFFVDGVHLKYYRNEKELIDQVRFYLSHSNQRNIIASTGQNEVLTKHTYDNRVNEHIIPALKQARVINV